MRNVEEFLKRHRLRPVDIDMENLVNVFTGDMINGLEGKESSLRMIPTYIEAENDFLTEIPVLAIDAGGTNFRIALIKFTRNGQIESGEIRSFRMPGLEKEISSREFFGIIADYIKPFAERSDRIGFCFSYPTEILSNRDGRLIQFCKEVKAPEVVGQLIGKNLLKELGTPQKHIVLLNDTVATLLAGKSVSFKKVCDSYIGFILGTGTNTCYIENNFNILKNKSLDRKRSQIINIESGNFRKAPRTDIDIIFDNSTVDPGSYTFEKMFSGGYFGGLCLTILRTASSEGVFSKHGAENILNLKELSASEANNFMLGNNSSENILQSCLIEEENVNVCQYIIQTLIDRAALLVAANLAAVVLKTDKGKSSERPVLITVEGTTFNNLHNLKLRFENYFSQYLNGEKKRFVEFTGVPQSSLVGAALAGLIE
jgi:hexokinase